jgi:hypothetical protein
VGSEMFKRHSQNGFTVRRAVDQAARRFYPTTMKQLLLVSLLFTGCVYLVQSPKSETTKARPSEFTWTVPKKTWEPIFFEEIDERTKIARLPTLRVALPKDDLELRIWNGFGLTALEGFVLKRSAGKWSAIHLDGIYDKLPARRYQKQLSAPKSGWNESWRKLMELGILTLPDAAEAGCSTSVLDGMSYVVEINHELTYRTYMYDNPSYAKCEQARTMIRIGNFIADEFNVPELRMTK